MRKRFLLAAVAVAIPLAAAGPAGAQVTSPVGARGQVLMTVHTHSGGTLFFPVERLPYDFQTGDTFSYSSRLCEGFAPFNDIGLNFIPDYPGVDDDDGTAYVRHHVEGTVTATFGNRGIIEGTLTTVLCVPGESPTGYVASEHAIVSHFRLVYTRTSTNDLHVTGSFQISPTESTGTFEDMVGGGLMQGRFTCLGGNPTCEARGEYADFVGSRGDPTLPPGQLQPGLIGTFYDPTVETVSD
jgi:hypothetical protein